MENLEMHPFCDVCRKAGHFTEDCTKVDRNQRYPLQEGLKLVRETAALPAFRLITSGSGHGKTSCRGHKGQSARAGGGTRPGSYVVTPFHGESA